MGVGGRGLDRRGGRLDFCMLVSAFLVDKNAMPSLKVGKNNNFLRLGFSRALWRASSTVMGEVGGGEMIGQFCSLA